MDVSVLTGRVGAGRGLAPGDIEKLRPYVVNLSQGRFSDDGDMTTDVADVDAIFDVHLPRFVDRFAGQVPLVIWAHGGLVSESTGLQIAANQIAWWLANDAYPLHFVWETGFFDAVKQILRGGARDLADVTIDPAVEFLARPLGSPLWTAMKTNAELASLPNDPGIPSHGARYVAKRLAEFCQRHPGRISLHAVGHSAGAIFHSYFLPAALQEGSGPISSLQLLAPAIRVDGFLDRLSPEVGQGVRNLTMYTMNKQLERDDNCAQIYRKSLLYLVSRAFEPEREAPILGLEESVRANSALVALFGLAPGPAGLATVVWSRTPDSAAPNSRSSSTSHGGFDNDVNTMNSVARRVLGRDAIVEFPAGARSAGIDVPGPPSVGGAAASERPSSGVASGWPAAPGGSRKALCVGIDAYPDPYTLGGCVADMTVWAGALRGRGFSVRTLQDGEATRTGILDQLTELITTAVPGDVLAFQYSGHGTQVPDLDGDEALDAINDDKDEAICPVDFDTGALIIDDELFAAFSALPAGVSLTTFFDCCHSGTNTKALNILAPAPAPIGTRRKRYIPATAALIAAHKLFRRTRAAGAAPVITNQQLRNVSIAACRDEEVAYESNGQGHFTKYAMQVLGVPGGELSNRSFTERVTALFGQFPEQRPLLHCRSELTDRPLLSGPGGTADGAAAATGAAATGAAATAAPTPDSRSSDGAVDAVSDILRSVVTLLEQH